MIYIAITTYNRPEGLQKLLKDIERDIVGFDYVLKIYDDCSNYKIEQPHFRFTRNNGKSGYWRVIDRVFQDASQYYFDYFFLLQDDCELEENFFKKCIEQWDKIIDKHKATFCPFTPTNVYNRVMWGGRAKDVSFREEKYINGDYVDCIFMCPRATLELLSFQVRPVVVDWQRYPNQSSGVGMQLTQRLREHRKTMYSAYSSLIITGKEKSIMNKEEREKNPLLPLIREEFTGKEGSTQSIFVGMASIPNREQQLYQSLKSIYSQVHKVFVALNGYEKIPAYANQFPNVEFILTTNEQGDANKFLKVGDVQGYFFGCDDDILYPKDYVKTMIQKIEQHRGIVTCHGRSIIKLPIQNYYRETQQFHFALAQDRDIVVDIAGTGVCAFHTDEVAVQYSDFPYPNMADIWIGKFAKDNNIAITCIARARRWLKNIRTQSSIYNDYKNRDEKQVEVINKWGK